MTSRYILRNPDGGTARRPRVLTDTGCPVSAQFSPLCSENEDTPPTSDTLQGAAAPERPCGYGQEGQATRLPHRHTDQHAWTCGGQAVLSDHTAPCQTLGSGAGCRHLQRLEGHQDVMGKVQHPRSPPGRPVPHAPTAARSNCFPKDLRLNHSCRSPVAHTQPLGQGDDSHVS